MVGSRSESAQMQGYAWAEGEERKRRRHMLPVSRLGMNTVASDSTTSSASVCQDGCKITVGDSAPFKPLQRQDSPPFIDIIIRDHPNACVGQQEEVDQLLDKTRLEMHAGIQSGGHSSSKPLNGPTPTSTPPIKNMLESEIAKITDKGGLVDFDAVEKFVQLMQPDRMEKKIDVAGRIMLVDVIASTNSIDCLGHFVQHRGLFVLDEWLQEVHKEKLGDGGSPKEGDKSIEEFLLALLRALDKLPVNLLALQTCNVRKSVNHLRSHKNLEIQKKARSLVDTWKKRVEAEMTSNDAKSGSGHSVSWPSKQDFSDVSHGGSKRPGGSSEVAVKMARSFVNRWKKLFSGKRKKNTWKKRVDAEIKIIEPKSGSGHAVSWPSKQGFSQVAYGGSISTVGSSMVGPPVSGSVQDSN